MGQALPSISGDDLIKLLEKNGWLVGKRANHGIKMSQKIDGKMRVTIIPTKHKAMPEGTLAAILGPKQTGIGRDGFLAMFYGT
jgi:predicted RNA binding protein YcfA (HicA-like mRNA interferase family)